MRRFTAPMVVAAALVAAAPASAQRASLADRVARLEAQAQNTQGNVDLLNQLTQLRSEVQALRSQLEELQQQNEQLRQNNRSQYLDLDGRLNRLEGRTPAAAPAASPAVPGVSASVPATPRDPAPRVHGDAGTLAQGTDERTAYNAAFDVLKAGRYADSARLFQDFLSRHPSGPMRRTRSTGWARATTSPRTTRWRWPSSRRCWTATRPTTRPPARC